MVRSLVVLLSTLLLAALANAGTLTVQSPRISITSSDGAQLRTEALTVNKPPSNALVLGPTDTLKLSFAVKLKEKEGNGGVRPHQTFLRFFDPVSGEEGIQPVRVTPEGKAKFELNMARPPASLPPTTTNPLHVTLLLGSFEHSPSKIELFDLVLPVSQPPPVHPDEASYYPLPEIKHTFRPDPKSPPKIVSGVFSLAVLAPWVFLLGSWASIGIKLPHITSLEIISFVSLLASFEYLLYSYWVGLKLGQVLTYGAVLGVFTAAAGNRALSRVAKLRLRSK